MSAPKRGSRLTVLDSGLGQYPARSNSQAPDQWRGTSGIPVSADFSIRKKAPSIPQHLSVFLHFPGLLWSLSGFAPACRGTSSRFLLPDGSAVERQQAFDLGPSSCPSAARVPFSRWFGVLSGCLIR